MMNRLQRHLQNGDIVYLVSASVNPYLGIWCRQQGIRLICSPLAICNQSQTYTGQYLNGDCSGDNKVKLIKQNINLLQFDQIYAYCDTTEDLEMLALADTPYYQGQKVT